MITVLCLNPCLDRTVTVPELIAGGMNRIESERVDVSGKGVNVALNLKRLGADCCCAGFAGADNAGRVTELLEGEGIPVYFERIAGAVRTNLKVLETGSRRVTEINEAGPPVTDADWARLEARVRALAAGSQWIVCTGSLPPGCPKDAYARVMRAVRAENPACGCVLDAEGEAFARAAAEKPDLVKPNAFELTLFAGHQGSLLEKARRLTGMGIGWAAVSMGADGALMLDGQTCWEAPAVEVPVRSTVGAGDALLSGILVKRAAGAGAAEAFGYGMAAAAAKVAGEGTQPIRLEAVEAMLGKVKITKVP
jgi:1-phosphofructokinase